MGPSDARAAPRVCDPAAAGTERTVREPDEPTRLDASKRQQAAELLGRAFQDDPVFRAVQPDAAKRRRIAFWLHDRMLRYCFLYGAAHTLPSLAGVACWLPPGQTELPISRLLRSGLLAMPLHMGPAAFLRFNTYIDCSSGQRRRNSPDRYWYLWVLGVDPPSQGRGVGGRLIQPVLREADATGTACYLETENPRNLDFYGKHGFRVAAEARVPRLGLTTWSLIREPVSP
jgi:ribosomal protein S18 acetylase RimI-like enzyme